MSERASAAVGAPVNDETDLLPGRKHALARLGRVLVLGLGKSGRALVDYCIPLIGSRIDELIVAGGERTEAAWAFAQDRSAAGVRFVFDHERIEGSYDLCIASPGIPATSAFYRSAQSASVELISEIEFAWRESRCEDRWVAVTGTNGKTTTTALAAHLLSGAGMKAQAVGNIGEVALAAVARDAADIYVAETSSYQLASTTRFAPDVAVILNITPDHLDWHGGFEAYHAAKLKVLARLGQVPGACAVLDATDAVVRSTVRELRRLPLQDRGFSYIPIGTASGIRESMRDRCGSDNAAFLDDAWLCVDVNGRSYRLARADRLALKGDHNVANALAAASAALALGADGASLAEGLLSFQPLEHRIETCGTINGITFVNDSKGTNADAAIKAIEAFPSKGLVVLLGGHDKGTDLSVLVASARLHAKAVVCFGEAGARIASAFLGDSPALPQEKSASLDVGASGLDASGRTVVRAARLSDAFDKAVSLAVAGDVVLLSPACSSFDEFSCYEERGATFKALVASLADRVKA